MKLNLVGLDRGSLLSALMGAALQSSTAARNSLSSGVVDVEFKVNGHNIDLELICLRLDRSLRGAKNLRGDTLMCLLFGDGPYRNSEGKFVSKQESAASIEPTMVYASVREEIITLREMSRNLRDSPNKIRRAISHMCNSDYDYALDILKAIEPSISRAASCLGRRSGDIEIAPEPVKYESSADVVF